MDDGKPLIHSQHYRSLPAMEAAVSACRTAGGELVGTIIDVDMGPNAGNRICYVAMQNGTTLELIQEPAA